LFLILHGKTLSETPNSTSGPITQCKHSFFIKCF